MSDPLEDSLITLTDPRSPVAEAFRTLRTNLEFSSLDRPVKTLVVTSAGPGEGKSTTLANLAVTTAQAERNVCLVDCDLRRPVLHRIFSVPNDSGLTDVIRDETLRDEPPLQETEVPGLRLLPSGPLPPKRTKRDHAQKAKELLEKVNARLVGVVLNNVRSDSQFQSYYSMG
jgi:non-specific protein-tyrosine kinase